MLIWSQPLLHQAAGPTPASPHTHIHTHTQKKKQLRYASASRQRSCLISYLWSIDYKKWLNLLYILLCVVKYIILIWMFWSLVLIFRTTFLDHTEPIWKLVVQKRQIGPISISSSLEIRVFFASTAWERTREKRLRWGGNMKGTGEQRSEKRRKGREDEKEIHVQRSSKLQLMNTLFF